jgi:sarcosine oxidase
MQMLNLAVRQGAEARFGTKVTAIRKSPYGLTVELNHQRTLETKKIIVSTGATIGTDFIEELKPFVSPKSVPIFWFKPKPEQRAHFSLGSFPAFLYQMVDGSLLYGAPEIDAAEPGVKIGFHNRQQTPLNEKTQGDRVDERFISQITEWVSTTFPGLDPAPCASRKCVYTMSVDESFFVDESKQFPGLFYSSSCSGHGFKFATGLGEVLSQTALGKPLANKVAAFNIGRLSAIAP